MTKRTGKRFRLSKLVSVRDLYKVLRTMVGTDSTDGSSTYKKGTKDTCPYLILSMVFGAVVFVWLRGKYPVVGIRLLFSYIFRRPMTKFISLAQTKV